ncbi:hypothetical protein JYU34_015057 [Plutella xylostella]|uniref:Spike glycoprotein G central domain-containing protein n=1 Tax=Plutella xylostella TaxID=51655 RepID=A0ABQ7Q672_PLUXY|nr:hypothetical protein JYU34_015057 [Plutella xylostella]
MKTNVKSTTFVLVTPHTVFDHYQIKYIDPILQTGSCTKRFCETFYDNVLWVSPNEEVRPTCHNMISGHVKICLGEHSKPSQIFVSSNYVALTSLEGACSGLNYCGDQYYLTRNGHIFKSSKPLPTLPVCNSSRVVNMDTVTNEVEDIASNLLRVMYHGRCVESVKKVRKGKNVTRFDLSFFHPLTSGQGTAFFLDKGQVTVGQVRYVDVDHVVVYCLRRKNCRVKGSTDGGDFDLLVPESLCNEEEPPLCEIGNGIIVQGGTLVNPQGIVSKEYEEAIFEELASPKVDRRIFVTTNDETHDSGTFDSDPHDASTWADGWITRSAKLTPAHVQMLTGHGGIGEYLYRFKLKESPECYATPTSLNRSGI